MLDLFLKSLVGFILFTSNAFAMNSPAERELFDLNDHLGLAQVLDAPIESYATLGQNYLDFENKYAEELKNKPKLRKKLNKSKRLAAIQAKFKSCLKRFGVETSLGRRILAAAFSIDPESFDCETDDRSLGQMLNNMEEVSSSSMQLAFRHQMSFNIKRNMATSMASMDYLISDGENMSARSWAKKVAAETLKKVCPSRSCTEVEKTSLKNAILDQVKKDYLDGKRPLSTEDVASRMSSDIRDINAALTDNIYVLDTPERGTGRNKTQRKKRERATELGEEQYGSYLGQYWEKTSSGYGLLFHTDKMKDKLGEPREFDPDDIKKKDHNIYSLEAKAHESNFSAADVTRAKISYLGEMSQVLKEDRDSLKEIRNGVDPAQLKENLKNSIKNYPMAAAQAILENPSSAKEICKLINEIEDEDESAATTTGVRRLALGVTGGVLLVGGVISSFTGVGATWGVPMMVAGAALTATEVGFGAYDYIGARAELEKLVQGQLSGSSDQGSLLAEQQLRDQASGAAWDVGTNLALSATGVGLLLKKSHDMAKLTGVAALGEDGVRTLKRFENTGDLQKIRRALPEGEYAEFAARLIHLPPKDAVKVMSELRSINRGSASTADFRRLNAAIDDAVSSTCRR